MRRSRGTKGLLCLQIMEGAVGAWGKRPCVWSICLHLSFVNEKLISQSKKEMENFIRAKFENCNLGRAS